VSNEAHRVFPEIDSLVKAEIPRGCLLCLWTACPSHSQALMGSSLIGSIPAWPSPKPQHAVVGKITAGA
jgi:hypothetical protein